MYENVVVITLFNHYSRFFSIYYEIIEQFEVPAFVSYTQTGRQTCRYTRARHVFYAADNARRAEFSNVITSRP